MAMKTAYGVREQIVSLALDYQLRGDWHEPDEQGITGRVTGSTLDNAYGDSPGHGELVLHLRHAGGEVTVNLANLLADYCRMAQEMTNPVLTKFLVYETFLPVQRFRAVEASGLHGYMEGIAPESRVYSWWARDAEDAVDMVNKFLDHEHQ